MTWLFCNTLEEKYNISAKCTIAKWQSFVKILWSKNYNIKHQNLFPSFLKQMELVFVILLICAHEKQYL